MKQLLFICALAAFMASAVNAEAYDQLGGPGGSQTVHHCGWLKTAPGSYTKSSVTTEIVEEKLVELGFLKKKSRHGKYTKNAKSAVRAFQRDAGLTADGVVGPVTAQRLAYFSHPSANVHRCYGNAAPLRS